MINDDCQQWLECQIWQKTVGQIGQEMDMEKPF